MHHNLAAQLILFPFVAAPAPAPAEPPADVTAEAVPPPYDIMEEPCRVGSLQYKHGEKVGNRDVILRVTSCVIESLAKSYLPKFFKKSIGMNFHCEITRCIHFNNFKMYKTFLKGFACKVYIILHKYIPVWHIQALKQFLVEPHFFFNYFKLYLIIAIKRVQSLFY